MNLGNQTKALTQQIGETLGNLYSMRLTSLQILILMTVRRAEHEARRTAALNQPAIHPSKRKVILSSAEKIRNSIEDMFSDRNQPLPTKAGFWDAVRALEKQKLIYAAAPQKGTSERRICLTAVGSRLFAYPAAIEVYLNPTSTPITP